MARPMGKIRILLSARVLFDLEEADAIFQKEGQKAYAEYMLGQGKYKNKFEEDLGGRKLEKGPMWGFAQTALALNKEGEEPVVEIGLLCKDTNETAVPIFRNLDVNGLDNIHFRMTMAGNQLDMTHHEIFGTDLLLSRNPEDVQLAVNNNIAAAVINPAPKGINYNHEPEKALRIFTDGDAVAVGSSSEVIYKKLGLDKYRESEAQNFDKPMEPGPFTAFLAKVSALNAKLPADEQPFKVSLLTARGGSSATHMITATRKLDISFNGVSYFMGGLSKATVLKVEKPGFFGDDQKTHTDDGEPYGPTGLVPYAAGGAMDLFEKNKEDITQKKAKTAAIKAARTPKPNGRR